MDRDPPQHRVLITPDDLVGFEIDGRYRLDAIIGGGGMGVVYRTTQQNLNREIAIKLLKLDDDGKHRVERFKREIDIISQLSHPNIVRVFDSGQDPTLGLHYIAMELVDGAPLDELMHGHYMVPELAIDIAYEVAAALTEPHRMGIVHRDIKPANVLLTVRSDDTVGVKVVDFGIARGGSGGSSRITTTGVVVGSPMYMAPEVARGESLDGRTDLYSLGVLLYEMVTGDTPFRGSTPVAIMLRHAVEEPPSLGESVGPDFAIPELVELVDELLNKERRDRPDDAKAVLRRLDEIRTAHNFRRVHVDGSKPIRMALGDLLVSMLEVPAETEGLEDADPYSATTPVLPGGDLSEGSESFSGWLVSDEARAALVKTSVRHHVAPTQTLDEPPPTRNVAPLVIGALLALTLLGAIIWGLSRPPEPDEVAVELGSAQPPPLVDAPPVPPEIPSVATAPDLGAVHMGSPDVGPDLAGQAPSGDEPSGKPRPRTEKSDDTPAPEKGEPTDNFDKGMQWLHKK